MIPDRDRTRLNDMLEYAREAVAFGARLTVDDMNGDRMRSMAIIRCIEVVGEAAAHVSLETRGRLPELPWPAIVGMRNTLIHGYWKIANNIVVLTVRDRLPPLIASLDSFIAENEAP